VHEYDRQTDHATEKSVAVCGIACAKAIPPNNCKIDIAYCCYSGCKISYVVFCFTCLLSWVFLHNRWGSKQYTLWTPNVLFRPT